MKAVFAFAVCATLYGQQASIEGFTVDAFTKAPIAGVHLRFVTGSSIAMTASYGAISDREGRFSIATIRPGTYIVFPERIGYFYAHSRADASIPNIAIHPGEKLTGMRIEMAPRAILSGKVVDEFGDPVQGVTVQTVSVSEKDGLAIMMDLPTMPTDDRGAFRVSTVQGRYYLQASPGASGNNNRDERPEVRMDGTSAAPYNITFYPSAVARERATPVDALGGKEISGIEIRLSRQKGVSISGTISGIPKNWWPALIVQWGKSAGQMTNTANVSAESDGRFTVPNAQPGFYRLWAVYYGNPEMASGFAEFQLDSSDITNVELRMATAAEVSGAVEFEGDPPGTVAEKRTVRLEPASRGAYNPLRLTGGETDEKGGFRLEGVGGAGKFRVKVEPLPENAYVKKVEMDGSVTESAIIDLKGGSRSRLKVRLSRLGGQLSGRVVDENGQRLLSALVMVMLSPVPIPEQMSPDMTAEINADGGYAFKGLRPGKYSVLAVDMLRVSGSGAQAAQLKLFEQGEEIEIKEGDRIDKELRLLPKEDASAKSKQ